MLAKQFGMVTVYVDEDLSYEPFKRVEINWSCCGSVSIKKAQKFYIDFAEALIFAADERARLEIKEG